MKKLLLLLLIVLLSIPLLAQNFKMRVPSNYFNNTDKSILGENITTKWFVQPTMTMAAATIDLKTGTPGILNQVGLGAGIQLYKDVDGIATNLYGFNLLFFLGPEVNQGTLNIDETTRLNFGIATTFDIYGYFNIGYERLTRTKQNLLLLNVTFKF